MNNTGATPPRRARLARIAEATANVGNAVRDHRRWARERQAALDYFGGQLGLGSGATPQSVLDAVTEARGRTVVPLTLPSLPAHITGIAVPCEDVDYIGLSDRLSRRHRTHVLLHEVRHLDLSDSAASPSAPISVHSHFDGVSVQMLREQLSVLPAGVREEILTRPAKLRADYETDEERRCEVFARVVLPLLDLDPASERTSHLVTGFANRRSI
ncbi:hypothetical protein [Streptomyces sp. NBC_00996]|uniref:hypothetical protein n=1 Tax=Streptomyces sp. NBC_00996 TaxID=2903710 RepID=UPI003863850E|nr:hypothetical protein OG390_00810 [Streptomyces sp. NBC_00996]